MLHFGKIPKKMVKFGENSAKFGQMWANLRNFGEKTEKNSAIFYENFEIRERSRLGPLVLPARARRSFAFRWAGVC
jgi:hypothetical protein